VLPTMAGSMEQVCVCVRAHARVLLWRWLGKRCCMSYHYSAILPFREFLTAPHMWSGEYSERCSKQMSEFGETESSRVWHCSSKFLKDI
jgi:hypothetical protein